MRGLRKGDHVRGKGLQLQRRLGGHRQVLQYFVSTGCRRQRINRRSIKAQLLGLNSPIDRDRRTGHGPAAERTGLAPEPDEQPRVAADVIEGDGVPQSPESDGAGRGELRMGLQREGQIAPILRAAAEEADQLSKIGVERSPGVNDVHHQQRRHLIVARAGRMDFAARLANEQRQILFQPGVDVFRRGLREAAWCELLLDGLQTAAKLGVLFLVQDAGRGQRRGVGPLEAKLKRKQEPVVGQTPVDRVERRMQIRLLLPQHRHVVAPRNSARRCPAN